MPMRAACATLGLAALLAAATAHAADAPQRGGTLTYSVTGDADTFDCHASVSVAVQHRLAPHYSLLVKIDPATYPAIVPDIAESWTVSPDHLTFTFRIRQGVRFHDGSVLTAADVKASFDRIRNPAQGVVSMRRGLFTGVTAIETPDERTAVFRIAEPDPAFLLKIATPWNCVYSAKLLAEDPDYPAKKVIGTGPFRMVERVPGSHWVGARFDDYYAAGRPYLDGFRAMDLAGPALLNVLAAGQTMADFRGISPVQRDRLLAQRGDAMRIYEGPQTASLLFTFNTTRKPFDDPRVRRALSLAIDRHGGADPIGRQSLFAYVGGFLVPGTTYARSEAELAALPGFARDIEASRAEARRLLAEAGVPALSFTFTNRPAYTPIGLYLIDQWRRVGVTVQHEQPENAPFFAKLRDANFDVLVDALNEPADDPSFMLGRFQSYDVTSANVSRAVDRTLDELYRKVETTIDIAARRGHAHAFEARMLTEAYSVPILWARRMIPVAAEVQGFHLTPSYFIGQDLVDLWIKK